MNTNKISPDDPRLTRLRQVGFGAASNEPNFNGTST